MAIPFPLTAFVGRHSLCLPGPQPGVAIHDGDTGYSELLHRHYTSAESHATDALVKLKAELAVADTETFWTRLMEGMTAICNAQYGFVSKRILVDDHDSAIEMPPLGSEGSCLLGVAFYFNDGKDVKAMHRDYKYFGWGAPCSSMKHDKVFLIPEKLSDFVQNNPNNLPLPCEAYLAVPLFAGGKCFAHFGMMWSKEGWERRSLSWSYVEMIMHSLEDLILARLLAGESFAKPESKLPTEWTKVIPQDAITTTQSLKPYAKSLSHELRTPMQGVVGMLDVMHATVQEAIEGQKNVRLRNIFQALKENIEVVQDSSRRAVEAADNVVHAYDMNMQVPDTPQNGEDDSSGIHSLSSTSVFEARPNIFIEGSNIPVNPYKRRRSSPVSRTPGNTKRRYIQQSRRDRDLSPRSQDLQSAVKESRDLLQTPPDEDKRMDFPESHHNLPGSRTPTSRFPGGRETYPHPSTKQSRVRDVLHIVINEGLLVGGRPDSAIAEDTEFGEKIEVRTRYSHGGASMKVINWSVAPDVPETISVDERDLTKLVSCVFLNAIKFTESGSIDLSAAMSSNGRNVLVKVVDTGMGIPRDFLPELFKPFSREDDSLTRSKEGLGLGLLVAKGLARKIGGDIECVRSETEGVNHGSEFDIKVPVGASGSSSRAHSPFSNRTPTPVGSSFHHVSSTSKVLRSSPLRADRPGSGYASPLRPASPSRQNTGTRPSLSTMMNDDKPDSSRRMSSTNLKLTSSGGDTFDRKLAQKYPLTFMVAEDNHINRRLLVTMLKKLGYTDIYEAYDGKEAVRVAKEVYDSIAMSSPAKRTSNQSSADHCTKPIDMVLMDLWMPEMDGYEATEKIFDLTRHHSKGKDDDLHSPPLTPPTILAVSADVTDEALSRATQIGMEGFMTKPYKLTDLQRLIEESCLRHGEVH